MARGERRRIVYNENAALVEENPSINTKTDAMPDRRATARTIEITVLSVLDAFASYTQFRIGKGNGKGKCAICGMETQYDVRKICVKCMKQYSEQLHEKAVSALELGDRTVSIEVVD